MPETRQRKHQAIIKQQKSEETKTPVPVTQERHEQKTLDLVKFLSTQLVVILAVCALGYYKSPITPELVDLPKELSLDEFIKAGSNILERGEHVISGLAGPESMEVDDHGNVYTGLLDGRIIKIHRSATGGIGDGLVEDIMSGPPPNIEAIDGHSKPRPLGLRLQSGILYVADAYYGLYSINLANKEITILVKPADVQPSMKFPNDLDISKDGEYIYFTDTSFRWNLHELYYDVLEGSCTGRFFRYSMKTGDIKVLANKLCFPNGVQLLDDGNTALVSETTRYRVLFVDTKHGNVSKFVLLPGNPDNIRRAKSGGFWVAIPIVRSRLFNFLMKYPLIRKIITGLFPISWHAKLSVTGTGLAVKFDQDGKILDAIYDVTGKVSRTVSQITEIEDGTLFAGSYSQPFMVKCVN